MNAQLQLMKQWLAALENDSGNDDAWHQRLDARTSLRAAIKEIEERPQVEMPNERIKGIFFNHGQYVNAREIALVRVIETMLKENK